MYAAGPTGIVAALEGLNGLVLITWLRVDRRSVDAPKKRLKESPYCISRPFRSLS
ncbi:hypothetical protein [Chelativorans sp. AA-79]|uniref:hypothetical protein n=1 Tax=Chelativorans sp. AA-79 TaxID=3028735 RepID=UPI0023F73765|nr:hypothetical protein [Chelativorans sp. AA-79]WEX11925.1 hypothetical protein PVE73_15590 [Chelativorans sp. AA-79]